MSSVTTNYDTAPTILSAKRNKYLKFVDNLDDYKVHHDDTDIRNFNVKTISGESIGKVEGLLADTEALRVRYVEVELDEVVINRHPRGLYTDEDRHVLVPIGLIQINESDRSVSILGV